MWFNSYPFYFLVIITFCFYYFKIFKNYQVYILIISSAVFYGFSQPYLLILLYLSASINAIASYITYFKKEKSFAYIGVIFNLLVLAFFKYNNLFDDIYNPDFSHGGLVNYILRLPLPIGISFYTFQGISLVLDVYKSNKNINISIESNFWKHYRNTIFFISFFPQLVAGPIVKAHDFFPQICRKYLKNIDWEYVLKTLILGYFLKSVIADNLKDQTFWIMSPYFESKSSLTLLVMLFGYSMQIFADFAGYSLIAIGVAGLFGYKLIQNFNFPYISTSITEFWRRWHISLSSWLKEYLYIDLLGGNRNGKVRAYINLVIVMFLGGMWHGAASNFGVWGLWHGLGLVLEKLFRRDATVNKYVKPFKLAIKGLFVFSFVSFGWLLFKLTNIYEAIDYLLAIKNNVNIDHDLTIILLIFIYSIPVVFYHAFYLLKVKSSEFLEFIIKYDYIIYASMIFLLLVNGGLPGAFVYFQF